MSKKKDRNEKEQTTESEEIQEQQQVEESEIFCENCESLMTANEDLQLRIEKADDALLRSLAEFDNFRKRNVKEKALAYDNGIAETVNELLPVIDNFERAASAETADTKYQDGIMMIYSQFLDILGKLGIKEIEALGKPFDPEYHNAVKRTQTDSEEEENTVCEVFQKGFIMGEKVIRHSAVAVMVNS